MAKFSAGLGEAIGKFGRPDPNAPAQPLMGTNDPLARSLGGMLGIDVRTGEERAAADIKAIKDPSSLEGLRESFLAKARHATGQKQSLYLIEANKIAGQIEAQKQSQVEKANLIKQQEKEQSLQIAQQEKEQKAAVDKAEATRSFMDSLAETLTANGNTGYANLVKNLPDFEAIPAEAQNRILAAAGITDPEDKKKALSPPGKLAVDMGYRVGTRDFQEKVVEIEKANVDEAFTAVTSVVKDTTDLSKRHKINDAIIAISSGGKAGADALQENTILDLFGSKPRAEVAVRRFAKSASLRRRVLDSIYQWSIGEKTALTTEDREALIYAALQIQKENLDTAVFNSASALGFPEETAGKIRNVYNPPKSVLEWEKRFVARYANRKDEDKAPSTYSANPALSAEAQALLGEINASR